MLEFIHKPTQRLDKFTFSPVGDKTEWALISNFMRSADETLGYVGCDDEYHYFQTAGKTNGFARIQRY